MVCTASSPLPTPDLFWVGLAIDSSELEGIVAGTLAPGRGRIGELRLDGVIPGLTAGWAVLLQEKRLTDLKQSLVSPHLALLQVEPKRATIRVRVLQAASNCHLSGMLIQRVGVNRIEGHIAGGRGW